jgi:hypothetical protein
VAKRKEGARSARAEAGKGVRRRQGHWRGGGGGRSAHVARRRGKQGGPVLWAGTGRLAWAGLKAHSNFLFIQNYLNEFELIQSKDRLSVLENFQIKYRIEGFEERNNFTYRNFSRFKMNLKLKLDVFPNLNLRKLDT